MSHIEWQMRDIIHITLVDSGGTIKHIDELRFLFPEYNHVTATWDTVLKRSYNDPCMLHVHTLWGNNISIDHYTKVLSSFSSMNIPIYLTVHDYQWLYPENPNIIQEDMQCNPPDPTQCAVTEIVFNNTSLIIFPTERLRDNYTAHLRNITVKSVIVPHCDIPIRMDQMYISDVLPANKKIINFALIGYCIPHKGAHIFGQMAQYVQGIGDIDIKFHMYGHRMGSNMPNIIYHDTYKDSHIIQQLHEDNIHVVFLLTLAEETYCYSLSRVINSGLPLVYLNRGAFMNRLSPSLHPRFFCADTVNDILPMAERAINFVFQNQGSRNFIQMSDTPEVNDWYRENYPVRASKSPLN